MVRFLSVSQSLLFNTSLICCDGIPSWIRLTGILAATMVRKITRKMLLKKVPVLRKRVCGSGTKHGASRFKLSNKPSNKKKCRLGLGSQDILVLVVDLGMEGFFKIVSTGKLNEVAAIVPSHFYSQVFWSSIYSEMT